MSKEGQVNINQELLNDLEQKSGLIEITSIENFENALKLDKAIVYLLVDWSGPERSSRYIVYNVLRELENEGIPTFMIDCSDQKKKYIKDWLIEQRENKSDFYTGGWGETVLIDKGIIMDYIANPAKLGIEKTKKKIKEWKTKNALKRISH